MFPFLNDSLQNDWIFRYIFDERWLKLSFYVLSDRQFLCFLTSKGIPELISAVSVAIIAYI